MIQEPEPAATDRRWRGLYATAGVAALLTAGAVPLQVLLLIVAPPPDGRSVVEWFSAFGSSPVYGLLSLDLVMMVEQVLGLAIAAALFIVLRHNAESTMALAFVAWIVAIGLLLSANTGFQMLSLSDAYADATSEAQRASLVAAGQAMLATYWSMGTAFVFGYLLSATAGILIGAAMLRSGAFGRAAGWIGIAGNGIGLAVFVPVVGIALSLVSVLILVIWWAIVGARLLGLARAMSVSRRPLAEPRPAAA